jgi:hypothetical protein
MLMAVVVVAGCAPQPARYRYSSQGYAAPNYSGVRGATGRKPVSLTNDLPLAGSPCPKVELSEADRAELFRQFDEWQKHGGTAPEPGQQVAAAHSGCAALP